MKAMIARTLAWVTLSLLLLLTFSRTSLAMSLENVKDGKVLLNTEGSSVKAGDTYLVSDAQGKKRAMVKVTQVRGGKALGTILKGKLTQSPKSYTMQEASGGAGGSGSGRGSSSRNPPSAWGAVFGYAQNQMKVANPSVDMGGNSFNIEAFYQRQIDGAVQMLARGGYQTFKVAGTNSSALCTGSSSCTLDISYLGLDGLVTYSFFTSKITYWLGAGLGFSYAMSKSSNVIDVSKISVNQKILVDLGLNWYLNRKSFIPINFEYAMFPNNSIVTSSQMVFRFGFGQTF